MHIKNQLKDFLYSTECYSQILIIIPIKITTLLPPKFHNKIINLLKTSITIQSFSLHILGFLKNDNNKIICFPNLFQQFSEEIKKFNIRSITTD